MPMSVPLSDPGEQVELGLVAVRSGLVRPEPDHEGVAGLDPAGQPLGAELDDPAVPLRAQRAVLGGDLPAEGLGEVADAGHVPLGAVGPADGELQRADRVAPAVLAVDV